MRFYLAVVLHAGIGIGAMNTEAAAGVSDLIFRDDFEPPIPLLRIEDVAAPEGDSGTAFLAVEVTLDQPSVTEVTVDYASTPGTAVAADDYTDVSGTLVIPVGETSARFEIGISGDLCVEDDETVTVALSNLMGRATLDADTATITIQTDDPLPRISIASDPPADETNSGTREAGFTLSLDRISCTDVSLDYATVDGTANGTDDFVAMSGSLVIAAFAEGADLSVTVNGDICVEEDEDFALSLSNLTPNAAFAVSTAAALIRNDDPLPVLDIAPSALNEGNAGSSQMSFGLSLDRQSCTDTRVDYSTSDLTATVADGDYVQAVDFVTIPAFLTTGQIDVTVNGDSRIEDNETFRVTLTDATPDIELGIDSATGTLINDDFFQAPSSPVLNDTGVVDCGNGTTNGLPCNDPVAGTDQFPGQDAEFGRDLTDRADGDGFAGFVFTRLDAAGFPLADESADYATSPWHCVRDEVTGLTWEVKSTDGALTDAGWTYSWFNSTGFNDGGEPGVADGGECAAGQDCDTESYVAAANGAALCGFTNWRLPGRGELLSLVHFGAPAGPAVDLDYFPNTSSGNGAALYWTADTSLSARGVRVVDFADGSTRVDPHGDRRSIRLVRGDTQ